MTTRQVNNNFSVLPFYGSIEGQLHRQKYSFGEVYPLYCQRNYLPTFQIMRPHRAANYAVYLHSINGEKINITNSITEHGWEVITLGNMDFITYDGNFALNINVSEGRYYISINDGTEVFYSEVFTMVENLVNYLKIEWYDAQNLTFDSGAIIYETKTRFKNRVYLYAEVGMPDYTFTEEGEERDGYFFPVKMLSEKTYKFSFTAPEFLLDAMRFIRLSDFVTITDSSGRVYKADTFLINPKWTQTAALAEVEAEFQTNTAVKKLARFVSRETMGDFNDDFNDDYN